MADRISASETSKTESTNERTIGNVILPGTEVRNPSFGAGTLVVTTRPDALADGSTVAVTQTGAPAGAGASSPASGKKPG